jgi:hypothetical protein
MSEDLILAPDRRSRHPPLHRTLVRRVGSGLTVLVLVPFLAASNCDPCPPSREPLSGFVDLHTHPVANVGFGGKLVYGGVSVGALLPRDPNCEWRVRATSEDQALGHDRAVHGGWDPLNNNCGDTIREAIIHSIQQKLGDGRDPPPDAFGFPSFQDWPVWNDITHQKMWVDWIRRSFNGGLRVMVALAVNNKTLGDVVSGPWDLATDDKASADLQIDEIKMLVANNPDFMEIALTADDITRITSMSPPKLAVVIGVEVDHIGNLQTATWTGLGPIVSVPSADEVKAEIHRLYDEGVRYIFPIHLLDNAFGGTATYKDLFNVSNTRESGAPWSLKCACSDDHIQYSYSQPGAEEFVISLIKLGVAFVPGPGPDCHGMGQRNARALTANGIEGIREMMRLGMMIDIDHMSQDAVDQALSLAEAVQPGGYPLNSGHNAVRGSGGSATEQTLTAKQYARIGALHGMAGVASGEQDAAAWLALYNAVTTAMGPGAVAGFGTDTNGFALGMPPRPGPEMQTRANPGNAPCKAGCDCGDLGMQRCVQCKAQCDQNFPSTLVCVARCDQPAPAVKYTNDFPPSTDHQKTWNYNTDGVAHYGMLKDFLMDVGSLPGGAAVVDNVNRGTEYFYQTWRKAEQQSSLVGSLPGVVTDVGTCAPAQ